MNLVPICSVPLWQSEYPEFNDCKELFLDKVKEYKEKNPANSNNLGYTSSQGFKDMVEFHPLYEYICRMAYSATKDLNFVECDIAITQVSLNISNSRQCMQLEQVRGEVFSGVFYLSTPKESGSMVLTNPAINRMWKGLSLVSEKSQYTAETIRIEPTEGNIIIFPSYLPHSVETNNHDEECISILFDLIALPSGSVDIDEFDS